MADDPHRSALLTAIAEQEAQVARIEDERERARARLGELQAAARTLGAHPPPKSTSSPYPHVPGPRTPAEKVVLFRQLFRGRHDVFPRLWVNSTKGTKGYAPACDNEWLRGICEKPRVKCGECPNQAFIPLGDQVILDHLQGRHVVGVYPLLGDDTCWFLAADFDGTSWTSDVAAFIETCRTVEVPLAVERSRSGNGAHAWFFFAAPVSASVARSMGCYLITETMARHHQLRMESYDRLFPNQDTLPRGGFGNLIALPLQHQARARGHTVFLDDNLEPYPDQWTYLASVRRMAPAAVEEIAGEATRRGQVLGVRTADLAEDADVAPWARSPSGECRPRPIAAPLPAEIRAVLAQRLFVEKAGLPSPLLDRIKRLAAFQNPEFYAKQSMRLSTATTPRVIACSEDLPNHIALPRGCQADLEQLLLEHGVTLVIDDQRCTGTSNRFRFVGELTPTQSQAARALLEHDIGVFVGPPGIGKTVLGAYLIAKRACSTLVLVHRRPLLDQWVAQLTMFLGLSEKEVGQIGGGKRRPNGRLDVAMIQSLVRKGNVDDTVAGYGHVVVDECHHVPAVSFERVLSEAKAHYVLGLTATPHRRDGHHPILEMQLGPVRFSVDAKSRAARRPFDSKLIIRETGVQRGRNAMEIGIQEIYAALAADESRNTLILNDVIAAVDERRSPILLTERRDHLEYFAKKLRGFVRHLLVLKGGMSAKERRELAARLAEVPEDEERLVLATGRYVGEGFDDARLDTLVLGDADLVEGYARAIRRPPASAAPEEDGGADLRLRRRGIPVLRRMFEKRLRTYRALGYTRVEPPFGSEAPSARTHDRIRRGTVRRVVDDM